MERAATEKKGGEPYAVAAKETNANERTTLDDAQDKQKQSNLRETTDSTPEGDSSLTIQDSSKPVRNGAEENALGSGGNNGGETAQIETIAEPAACETEALVSQAKVDEHQPVTVVKPEVQHAAKSEEAEATMEVAELEAKRTEARVADVTQSDVAQSDFAQSDVTQSDVTQSDVTQSDVTQSDAPSGHASVDSSSMQTNRPTGEPHRASLNASDSEVSDILRDAMPATVVYEGSSTEGGQPEENSLGKTETVMIMKKTFTESILSDREFIPIFDEAAPGGIPSDTGSAEEEGMKVRGGEAGNELETRESEAADENILSKAQTEARDLTCEFRRLQFLLENLSSYTNLETATGEFTDLQNSTTRQNVTGIDLHKRSAFHEITEVEIASHKVIHMETAPCDVADVETKSRGVTVPEMALHSNATVETNAQGASELKTTPLGVEANSGDIAGTETKSPGATVQEIESHSITNAEKETQEIGEREASGASGIETTNCAVSKQGETASADT